MAERSYFESPPRVGTAAPGDNSEKAASTAYVDDAVAGGGGGAHATTHEVGGGDEVDVTALDGFPGGTTLFLRADGSFAVPAGGSGTVVQIVNTQTGALATGTTVLPLDDTIPQNNEGNEYMTLAITPTDVANNLRIDVTMFLAANGGQWVSAALFQDTTANALAAFAGFSATANAERTIHFTHVMAAGTTSATTFKVRAGPNTAGTVTFNGTAGGRQFGGVMASSITITEYVP